MAGDEKAPLLLVVGGTERRSFSFSSLAGEESTCTQYSHLVCCKRLPLVPPCPLPPMRTFPGGDCSTDIIGLFSPWLHWPGSSIVWTSRFSSLPAIRPLARSSLRGPRPTCSSFGEGGLPRSLSRVGQPAGCFLAPLVIGLAAPARWR